MGIYSDNSKSVLALLFRELCPSRVSGHVEVLGFVEHMLIRDMQKVWADLDVGTHWVFSIFIPLPLSETCQNRKSTSILQGAIAAQESV